MAVITKRGKDQYQAKIRRTGHPSISKTFPTKTLAQMWARKTEADLDAGEFKSRVTADSMDLSTAIQRYIDEIAITKKSCADIQCRLGTIAKHLGDYKLATLSPKVISGYRDFRLNTKRDPSRKGVSNESVLKELSMLGRVLSQCESEWEIHFPQGNPMKCVKKPPKNKPRERRLEEHADCDEETILLQKASESKSIIGVLIKLAIETGMRRSEIVKLEWKNINFKKSTALLIDTKNGDNREVALSPRAIQILKAQPKTDSLVFPIKPNSVSQAFRRLRKRCGLDDIKFHDMRHEATSRFFESGLQMMEVSTITGHKDLRMLKRYTHLKPENIAKKLAELKPLI